MEVGLDGPLALVSSMIYKKISNKRMKEKKSKWAWCYTLLIPAL